MELTGAIRQAAMTAGLASGLGYLSVSHFWLGVWTGVSCCWFGVSYSVLASCLPTLLIGYSLRYEGWSAPFTRKLQMFLNEYGALASVGGSDGRDNLTQPL